MRLLEIYFWNAVYWTFYLPTSILFTITAEERNVFAILLIGMLCSTTLTTYLAFQNDILFRNHRQKTKLSVPIKTIKPLEVKKNAKKEETKNSKPARIIVDFEPEPKMRTDVNLSSIDADDNIVLS